MNHKFEKCLSIILRGGQSRGSEGEKENTERRKDASSTDVKRLGTAFLATAYHVDHHKPLVEVALTTKKAFTISVSKVKVH